MSLGGGLVMWGTRQGQGGHEGPGGPGGTGGGHPPVSGGPGGPGTLPAYYAARPGGWRDWWTLLHPPYTAWHLSYVVIGAALAPRVLVGSLIATVLAFFLAVGLAAHALDELRDRPLRTAIPSAVLVAVVAAGLAGALVLGVFGVIRVGWTLIPFMVAGPVLVIAYNADLFGGLMHTDFGFAAGSGASRCSPPTWRRPARWPWHRCWPRSAPSRCPRPSAAEHPGQEHPATGAAGRGQRHLRRRPDRADHRGHPAAAAGAGAARGFLGHHAARRRAGRGPADLT